MYLDIPENGTPRINTNRGATPATFDADDKVKKSRGGGKGSILSKPSLLLERSWFSPLLICVFFVTIFTFHTNRSVAASEAFCKTAIASLEVKLTNSDGSAEQRAKAAAELEESRKALISLQDRVDSLANELQASGERFQSSLSSLGNRVSSLAEPLKEMGTTVHDTSAIAKLLSVRVEKLEAERLKGNGGGGVKNAANKRDDSSALLSADDVADAALSPALLAQRLHALQQLVEQAHVAIRDINSRIRLYESVEASMRELRHIIGMPELGANNNDGGVDGADQQQRVLAEIADRQAREQLHGNADQFKNNRNDNFQQQQRPNPKGQFVQKVMADNYRMQQEQQQREQQQKQQQQGENYANNQDWGDDYHRQKYPQHQKVDGNQNNRAPYEEMGDDQQQDGQQRVPRYGHNGVHANPEDAKYQQYHNQQNQNNKNNREGGGYEGVDPYRQQQQQNQQHFYNNNPYARGQMRAPVKNPVADIVDPGKRSVKQAQMVKDAMKSAWGAYKRYAWGHDELKPVSKTFHDWGGRHSLGVGLTAVDSLSTLWLMGMHAEFEEAVQLLTEEIDYNQNIRVSVFEYTIRVVGGLLSAYELSGENNPKLLTTAQLVMDKLLVAYNTSTGLPHQTCNLKNKKHWSSDWGQGSAILSEFGTVQLELRTLSYHTKNPLYDIKATHITDLLEHQCKQNNLNGLCPTFFDLYNSQPRNDQLTLGALGDSYYEYLLKQYLLTGRREERYKRMALEALDTAIDRLLQYSSHSRQAYFADISEGMLDMKMDHLACFSGGMYALAADTFPNHDKVKTYRKVAEGITKTCNEMYERQLSGLAPEYVVFTGGQDFVNGEGYNILRPEALESMFYQWRMTKDQKYRDMAWEIFLRYITYCSTPSGGFSGVSMVTIVPPEQDDMMQSFFLSETLKYLYLIFSEDDVLDLSSWVLNTEAHPLKIRNRDPMDIWVDWEKKHGGEPAYMPPTVNGVPIRTETEAMKAARGKDPIIARRDPFAYDQEPPEENDDMVEGANQDSPYRGY